MADLTPIDALRGSLPVGVSSFGPLALSAGATSITLVLDRTLGIALKTRKIKWSLELSLDAAKTWIPWGAAETTAGVVTKDLGIDGLGLPAPATESSFTVSLPKGADANTLIRGFVEAAEILPTAIVVRSKDDPLPVAALLDPVHASVSTADITSASAGGIAVTSLTTPSFTITSNTNRAGWIHVFLGNNAQAITSSSIGGTACSIITGTDSGAALAYRNMISGVAAPPSGSQTATASWNIASNSTIGAVATSGVDQTTPFNNGTFSSGLTGSPSLAITSTSGDLTTDVQCNNGSTGTDTTNQTSLWFQRPTGGSTGAGGRGPGTGTTTHTWTTNGTAFVQSGCNVVAAPSDTLMGQAIL